MIPNLPTELLRRIFQFYVGGPSEVGRDGHKPSDQIDLESDFCASSPPGDLLDDGIFPKTHFGAAFPVGAGSDTRLFATPIHLAVICRRWRAIALSTPELWSWVDVRGVLLAQDVDIFRLWVKRSEGALIDLTICNAGRWGPSRSGTREGDVLLDVLRIAIGALDRWRTVRLVLDGIIARRAFQLTDDDGVSELTKRPPPVWLEAFDLEIGFDVGLLDLWGDPAQGLEEPIHAISRALCRSPRLTKARWRSCVDGPRLAAYLPFTQLRSLGLEVVSDAEASAILQRCTELRELDIRSWTRSSRDDQLRSPATSPILLPKLEVASIRYIEKSRSVPTFFQAYRAPALRELRLERGFGRGSTGIRVLGHLGMGVGDEEGWRGLVQFLERSGCTLRKLAYCTTTSLTPVEHRVMQEYLKRRVFAGLVVRPRARLGKTSVGTTAGHWDMEMQVDE